MDGTENHFPAKMRYISGFCIYNLQNISGVIPPDPTEAM